MIKILQNQQEVQYQGNFIPFNKIKSAAIGLVSPEYLERFVILKKFNKVTGNVDRKYAWDSLMYEMRADGLLKQVLDAIIKKEE